MFTFGFLKEVSKHFLGMSGECGQLPDDVGQAAVGDPLEFIRHWELQRAPAHVHWHNRPLRQRHADADC